MGTRGKVKIQRKRGGWSNAEHDKPWIDRRGYQRHMKKLSFG
jgi:hypothetical protein